MGEFKVSRARHTSAAPSQIHALIDDFRNWPQWSPWEGLDDTMTRTYEGPEQGVGSRYAWKGNKKAGSGHMKITESTPQRITVALTFTEPFSSDNTTVFDLRPSADGGTDVSWTMTGPQSVAQKIFFTVFRMNKKVEKDFDKGLAALAAAAERS